MNWSRIAEIGAAITGASGLIGFIVFAILRLASDSGRQTLSVEAIAELKKHGIPANDIKGLTRAQLEAYLQPHENISASIIENIIAPQTKGRARVLFIASVGLLVLAITLAAISFGTTNESPAPIGKNTGTAVIIGKAKDTTINATTVNSSFPQPTSFDLQIDDEKKEIRLVKNADGFAQNVEANICFYVTLNTEHGCSCIGYTPNVPFPIGATVGKFIEGTNNVILTFDVDEFVTKASALRKTWSDYVAKLGMCGDVIWNAVVISKYDDQFATNRRADFEIENTSKRGYHWEVNRMESERASEFLKEIGPFLQRPTLSGDESGEQIYGIMYRDLTRGLGKLIGEYDRKEKPNKHQPIADQVFEGQAVRHYLETKAIYTKFVAKGLTPPIAACKPIDTSKWVRFPGFKPITIYSPPGLKLKDDGNSKDDAQTKPK
jgi:hypothetical protein